MPDFGFVGPAYEAANPLQDNQRLINWFVETDRNPEAKAAVGLLGCPGLVDLGQSTYTGEVRGFWSLPGGDKALAVVGSKVLMITVGSAATASSRPTFVFTKIGDLLTTGGQVKIRDNGQGHVVVIVDGPSLYTYNANTSVFSKVYDSAFLGSYVVAEIDRWFIFAKPGSQTFYTSPFDWNGTTAFDGTYFALKDNAPDNIVALMEQNRELWVIGEATTEVWYNAGGATFPFSRLQGTLQQVGCSAVQSVARHSGGLVWLGKSERGVNSVVMTKGYEAAPISNPALSYALNQYPVISDAIGSVYTEEGHEFYVLTFPSADVTWVYDLTIGVWHQRASFDPSLGLFHRARANCSMNFQNMHIVGDYLTGQIYWQTRTAFDDAGRPLVAVRRAPHVWDKQDRKRVRHNRLQLEFNSGGADQGTNPQAMLRWSNDGGKKWIGEQFAPIGKSGETETRVIWRRLGMARDRVYEVRVSDAVNRDIVGASLQAEVVGA